MALRYSGGCDLTSVFLLLQFTLCKRHICRYNLLPRDDIYVVTTAKGLIKYIICGACKDIYVPVQLFWAISLFV